MIKKGYTFTPDYTLTSVEWSPEFGDNTIYIKRSTKDIVCISNKWEKIKMSLSQAQEIVDLLNEIIRLPSEEITH